MYAITEKEIAIARSTQRKEQGDFMTLTETHAPFTIIPELQAIQNVKEASSFMENIHISIHRLLSLTLGNDCTLSCPTPFLGYNIPLVYWEFSQSCPGTVTIYLLTKPLSGFDLGYFFSEIISQWMIPDTQATVLSNKSLLFRFKEFPKEIYLFVEIFCFVDSEMIREGIQKNLPHLAQEIKLGALSPHHARHILATKGLTHEQKITLIHKSIIEISNRKFKSIDADIFFEMHHFLVSCDDEFKKIRDVRHLCRIICYHHWFRKLLRLENNLQLNQRHLRCKVLKTKLSFPFGSKDVLGIVIAINFVKDYEQFEARHILKACQRFVPSAVIVPQSYFCYQHPSDSVYSLYLELEKKAGHNFDSAEIQSLKEKLSNELQGCVERMSSSLFMPKNEEEVMRNILTLSKEIKYLRDEPQMIITFQGQSEAELSFHVTLVRIRKPNSLTIQELSKKLPPHLLNFIPGICKIVGKVRNKYPKEANTFTIECQKEPFIRQDHAIDLWRARQFIVSTIHEAYGKVRDFNGGLIGQQDRLLSHVKNLLTSSERDAEFVLENLFYSICPVLMQSLLSPEQIYTLFQLLVKLRQTSLSSHQTALINKQLIGNTYFWMLRSFTPELAKEAKKKLASLQFKDADHAFVSLQLDGNSYFGFIILHANESQSAHIQNTFNEFLDQLNQQKKEDQLLRISLPRPTSSLDPRIGADRTSGLVIKMLYEGLMRISPDGKSSYAIAESVDISPDCKTYTFHLRSSKWSNNKSVTAFDFEYAWKKVIDPNFKTFFAYLFYPIKNAQRIKNREKPLQDLGVRALNELTLQVDLEHPTPYFLELTSHWTYSPLCKELDQLYPGWAYYGGDTHVSNGPFRLSKWRRNTEIQLIKNQTYWDAQNVILKQIDISIIESPQQAMRLFEQGQLDWIGEPLSEIPLETLKNNSTEQIQVHPITAVFWFEFNVQSFPLSSCKLRKALRLALNRQELINGVLCGNEKPALSILPPSLALSSTPYFKDGDVQQAQLLFQEFLQEKGLTIENFPKLTILCCDQELQETIAHTACKQWKKALGIDVSIETFKWAQYMNKCLHHDFQILSATWYSWVHDPIYNLDYLKFGSEGMNATQWQNQDYIQLLDQAQTSTDLEERRALMAQAELLAIEETPLAPVFYYNCKFMHKKNVKEIYLSHLGQIDFKWAHVVKQI